jgi:hypothetical protein
LVRPGTSHEPAAPVTVQLFELSSTAVTAYEAGAPPEPAATVTIAALDPAVAVGIGGAPGAAVNVPDVIKRLPVPVEATATNIPPP